MQIFSLHWMMQNIRLFNVRELFIVANIVCGGSVFGPCFVIQYFVPFYFCNHRNGEERALL